MVKYNALIFSGVPASGKSTLAQALSKSFKCPVLSMGGYWVQKYRELHPNGEVSFEEYWAKTTIKENLEADEYAKKILRAGHIIGDMRYTLICKDLPALRVFINADLNIRAQRSDGSLKYAGKNFEEIKEILARRESDELRCGKEMYGNNYDYRDSKHYHLVINSGLFSLMEEERIVRKVLFSKLPKI